MTSFVHLEYSNQHPGVARIEAALGTAQQFKQKAATPRTLATLLLSAIAAAAMVVAYQIMDSIAEGHLVALWMGLWMVAFATLAAFAGTARRTVASAQTGLDAWSRKVAARRSDERMWAAAQADPRIMADLQCALARGSKTSAPNAKGSKPATQLVAKPADADWINTAALRYGQQIPFV